MQRATVAVSDDSLATGFGLSEAQARRRLAEIGPNAVHEDTTPVWRLFLRKFWAPVPWLLEAAIALQLVLGARIEAAVIGALLVSNALLAFFQEGRANRALTALKQNLAPTALVCRSGRWQRRPAAELVPGDAIRLSLGALVPADARLVSGSVQVDQSTLSGESVPVEAGVGDMVYAGALVRRGQALAEVSATGPRTYFGRAAELVRIAHAASTEQSAVLGAVRRLALINGAVAALILGYAHWLGLPAAELVRLLLTALLASIPVALPATFTLSAALSAQALGRGGVLLTRLSAVHEAAAMDLLCSDKTGTLTCNTLEVEDVVALPGYDRDTVLALAALASCDADQDAVDAAILRAAAGAKPVASRTSFVPFDPATKRAEALAHRTDGSELRIVKGALQALSTLVPVPPPARAQADALAAAGHRVLAVAAGPHDGLRLAGLIALSDPPRPDSAELIRALTALGVRTIMLTGDSAVTAAAVARELGLDDAVCPAERLGDVPDVEAFGVYARVLPEDKFRLVQRLQAHGRVVGMCGDGTNDAPALRQAQVGIAVSSATDAAKAAAAMVLTRPGLSGVLAAVREGRTAFQRLRSYTLNMLVKKIELVLLLAAGLLLTGGAVLTPTLMVLLLVTNDLLTMSLTTDRTSPGARPGRWNMRLITRIALAFGLCKLAFSIATLMLGKLVLGIEAAQLQTLAFVAVAFGNQAVLYVVRERRRLWSSRPSGWLLLSSVLDLTIISGLALSGTFMAQLEPAAFAFVALGATALALTLDQLKSGLAALERADCAPLAN
jgi:H+-transporting ATPase